MRSLLVVVIAVFVGGCGKKDEIASVPLSTPWTSWQLPELSNARVMSSSDTAVKLFFSTCDKPESMFTLYDSWLVKQGWKQIGAATPQTASGSYMHEGKRVSVGANALPRGGCQLSLELQCTKNGIDEQGNCR